MTPLGVCVEESPKESSSLLCRSDRGAYVFACACDASFGLTSIGLSALWDFPIRYLNSALTLIIDILFGSQEKYFIS